MRNLLIAITIVLLTGCASRLQSSLVHRGGELLYLQDSAKITEKQGETLKIGSFVVNDVLPPSTTVKKEGIFILPLGFVNIWKFDYQSSLGYAQIGNDYKQFMRDSFIEELKRSGKFKYVEDNGDTELDVEIKTITMSAPISKRGDFLFLLVAWAYSQSTLAGPVDVVMMADAVLKKDGKELFSKEFQGQYRTNTLSANYNTENKLLGDFQTAMIECLSLAIKDLNENIVKEINKI